VTAIAAAIMVRSLEQALADAARAAEFGADLVELRIDAFTDDPARVTQLVERSPLPCIVTCRHASEGGEYDGDEQTRLSALEHAGVGARKPAYIDLELAAYQTSANLRQKIHLAAGPGRDTGLILSTHDFQGRPADLLQRVEAMAAAEGCRVIKAAWFARSLRDNLEAFELLRANYKPTVTLCMGEFGTPSRVLAKKFGALLTFAAVDADNGTAPGQPTIAQLKSLYRWDKQRAETKVYGVIGDPVGHSLSPRLHNAGFDAIDYDGVYLPMRIPPEYEHFKATVGAWLDFAPLHFRGASVTIPHKENLLRFVKEHGGPGSEIEPLTEKIGAANTLAVRDDGSLYAANTDYAAALDAVCGSLRIDRAQLAGKRVAVLGAGGAARAIVAGFTHYGAHVTIHNRTPGKAKTLADQFGAHAASFENFREFRGGGEVLINCTPIGMHPEVDASPVPADALRDVAVVFDTIYNPVETKLLRDAQSAGAHVISGLDMFYLQGAAQFELWTGQPAPMAAFRAALGG